MLPGARQNSTREFCSANRRDLGATIVLRSKNLNKFSKVFTTLMKKMNFHSAGKFKLSEFCAAVDEMGDDFKEKLFLRINACIL